MTKCSACANGEHQYCAMKLIGDWCECKCLENL